MRPPQHQECRKSGWLENLSAHPAVGALQSACRYFNPSATLDLVPRTIWPRVQSFPIGCHVQVRISNGLHSRLNELYNPEYDVSHRVWESTACERLFLERLTCIAFPALVIIFHYRHPVGVYPCSRVHELEIPGTSYMSIIRTSFPPRLISQSAHGCFQIDEYSPYVWEVTAIAYHTTPTRASIVPPTPINSLGKAKVLSIPNTRNGCAGVSTV